MTAALCRGVLWSLPKAWIKGFYLAGGDAGRAVLPGVDVQPGLVVL
jgi:hypothetical protein